MLTLNSKTHKLKNSLYELVSRLYAHPKLINSKTPKLKNSLYELVSRLYAHPKLINSETHQLPNSKTPQLKSLPIKQRVGHNGS